MTSYGLEVPPVAEIIHLPVELVPVEGDGVVSVRAYADDGDAVRLTWDVFACSCTIWWMQGDVQRLRIERELATKVSIREDHGAIEFWCWTRGEDFAGTLVVRLASCVTVSDTLLRQ